MGSRARLCRVVEGVEFNFIDRTGNVMRGIVTAETLQRTYGARPDQMTWLPAFDRYRAEIEGTALAMADADAALFGVVIVGIQGDEQPAARGARQRDTSGDEAPPARADLHPEQ